VKWGRFIVPKKVEQINDNYRDAMSPHFLVIFIIIIIIIIININKNNNEFHYDAIVSQEDCRAAVTHSLLYVKINDKRRWSPYERRNNSVFSTFLNWSNDGSDVIDGGRLFQTFVTATKKARLTDYLYVILIKCGQLT